MITDVLIRKFSDGSYFHYTEGKKNKFLIVYVDKKGETRKVNGLWALEKLYLLGNRHNKKRLTLNDMMNVIGKLEYKNIDSISDIANKYSSKLNENNLFIEKHLCLMISFYHAEENWISENGNPTIFGRKMYESEFKRVAILGQSVEDVKTLYTSGQSISNLIHETDKLIEKMTEKLCQKSLLYY